MKKSVAVIFLVLFFSQPCLAVHIEVLQVSNIGAFDDAYNGFVSELASNGIVEGENLTITRHIIDADADVSLWKKVGILLKIKSTSSKIVDAKPDLVLTISTPATKYSMNKIIDAGIPLVFSCVANPPIIGCPTVEKSGPGFTGATLYQDPLNFLVLAQITKPDLKVMGLIHSDDDNAIAFADEIKAKAAGYGITIVPREVDKSESIKPAALELIKAGVDSFAIPLDAYYGLRNLEPGRDLFSICKEHKIPVFAFANYDEKGALLYAGPDFKHIGVLSGKQAVKILKENAKPEDLPILKQEDLNIYVDTENAKQLGIDLPEELLKIARKR